jgi:hypothetical protein
MANQCLTSIAERQIQTEIKTAKKTNTKKQQTSRSKCYCSCCSYHHQHQFNIKDQRRPTAKTSNSPNAEICALLQMPQSIPPQDFSNEDILTVQTSLNNNTNMISDGDLHNKSVYMNLRISINYSFIFIVDNLHYYNLMNNRIFLILFLGQLIQ